MVASSPRPADASGATKPDGLVIQTYRRQRLLAAMDRLVQDASIEGFPHAAAVLRQASNELRRAVAASDVALPPGSRHMIHRPSRLTQGASAAGAAHHAKEVPAHLVQRRRAVLSEAAE